MTGSTDASPAPISLAHEPPMVLGALTIEPSLRRVRHADGGEAVLQPRVMQVLVALLQAREGILTRQDLTERCWGGVVVGEDAINRVIAQLRRLSEGLGAGSFEIATINRVGYRIIGSEAGADPVPLEPLSYTRRAETPSICVLPFTNRSDDPQQGYFSDGISEDIITDLSRVSALKVVSRNAAFALRGEGLDARAIARRFKVSHVLEGSVRRAGERVRITAQLVDGANGEQIWAERWDREFCDIFALQDEIAQAVVAALKVRIAPGEGGASERRGTASSDAYALYLQARQLYVEGNRGDPVREDAIERLARKAIEIDPAYARAWALLGLAGVWRCYSHGKCPDEGLVAMHRALELDPQLAEAHAVKAQNLWQRGDIAGAFAEVATALRLDPDCYEAHEIAGLISYRQGRFADAIGYFERASALMASDYSASGMLISCYAALGDMAGEHRAARTALARSERVLACDAGNGSAAAFKVGALIVLGEVEQARAWIERALKFDQCNLNARYNFACALSRLGDLDGALDHLRVYFAGATGGCVVHARTDPDFEALKSDPRFLALAREAEARLNRRAA